MNNNIRLYNVAPSVPEELRFLEELSFNMWWCYHPEAQDLFERIDPLLSCIGQYTGRVCPAAGADATAVGMHIHQHIFTLL